MTFIRKNPFACAELYVVGAMKAIKTTETSITRHKPVPETLHITQSQKLSSVQKRFNDMFPYLKLEFFKGSPKKSLNSELILGYVHKDTRKGELFITQLTLVKDLEKNFFDLFKIGVTVLRRSGKSWLETRFTNDWSLSQQNKEGRELSIFLEE